MKEERTSPTCHVGIIYLTAIGLVVFCGASLRAAEFTLGVVSGEAGGRIVLPIEISGDDAPVAMQFDLLYNSARVVSEPALIGSAGLQHRVVSRQISEGRRRVLIYANPNAEVPDGATVEVPFTASPDADAGSDSVTLSNIRVALASGEPAGGDALVTPGTITTSPALGLPVIADFSISTGGQITFGLRGNEGDRFAVDVSGDLKSWQSLATVEVNNGEAVVTDPGGQDEGKRFYRVRRLQ